MLSFYLLLVNDDEDRAKIEYIYNNCRDYMYYKAYSVCGNEEDAKDAVSDAFYKLAKNAKSVDISDLDSLRYFCGRTAENAATDLLRDKKSKFNDIPLENIENTVFDVNDIPFEKLYQKESVEEVLSIIRDLKPKHRDIIMMNFVRGMSYAEIAEFMDLNPKTVSACITRIRGEIIEKLKGSKNDG